MSEAEEIAKAVQEAAKLGDKGLDTAQKAGSFFAKVFKSPLNEISGIIHDKLRFIRWKRFIEMSEEVNAILKERGITETRPLIPKLAIPLIENASIEDEEDIKSLWSILMANALDPNFDVELRFAFIEIIKSLSPLDVKILDLFYKTLENGPEYDFPIM